MHELSKRLFSVSSKEIAAIVGKEEVLGMIHFGHISDFSNLVLISIMDPDQEDLIESHIEDIIDKSYGENTTKEQLISTEFKNILETERKKAKDFILSFEDYKMIKFWDITEKYKDYTPITKEQGEELKDFILKNKDKRFLIHCSAGISRSAGVGMAVECLVRYNGCKYSYKTGSSAIKSFRRYSPNLKVFDTIIK